MWSSPRFSQLAAANFEPSYFGRIAIVNESESLAHQLQVVTSVTWTSEQTREIDFRRPEETLSDWAASCRWRTTLKRPVGSTSCATELIYLEALVGTSSRITSPPFITNLTR
jgi:hypothetical protein